MIATPPHLGGHLGQTWVDAPVLQELARRFAVRSMLDVGCGPGGMRDVARDLGIAWAGADGDPAVAAPDVTTHDYAAGPLVWPHAVDLVWSVEFVEHVDEAYQFNYLVTFRAGRVLFLTHALPGQGGHHHVCERPGDYWRRLLTADGWACDEETTAWVRAHGTIPFARWSGLVMRRAA